MIYIFQYIFNSQFSCSCTNEFHFIVVIYLGLIPVILFFILKIMKQTKTKNCAACCCGVCPQFFQLLGIVLFWGGFVLLDGDLYLCLVTKQNETLHLSIIMKQNNYLNIKHLLQLYGYISIAIGFCGWWLISKTKIGMHCDSISCQCLKEICCNRKPYYKVRYEEFLSEETDKHLDETLRQMAKRRAERICSNYICDIENSEFRYNENKQISEKAMEAWSNISRSNFYVEKLPKVVN
ncbi:Calcium homeostasis modulator protein 2 [Labeo rohita]|uniref:Calcium homeostasis modulator protein 2 n=1 Tax=Labeo rohita TaxID=84645 RepID=A0ABQ8MCG2_LABRO|nr:Calcium homeostasis modulator protein 2 [Labeo rohita]